jgi:hypothetical protein
LQAAASSSGLLERTERRTAQRAAPKRAKMLDIGEAIKLQQHTHPHPPGAAAHAAAAAEEPQQPRRRGPAKEVTANGAAQRREMDLGEEDMEEGEVPEGGEVRAEGSGAAPSPSQGAAKRRWPEEHAHPRCCAGLRKFSRVLL